MAQTNRFSLGHDVAESGNQEREVLMELADELLQDNYGSAKFRELLAQTDIVDTGLRWQVSNEITRRLVQHVLSRNTH